MRLAGDIGGTTTRLALCENGVIVPQTVRNFANDDWAHLNTIIAAFLKEYDVSLTDMVIAVAGPVHGGHASLTNRDWRIDREELITLNRCGNAFLLNDLSALGFAVPVFQPAQLHVVHQGNETTENMNQSLVVGIGTGFNVSPVLEAQGQAHCLAAEAGHMSMPHAITQMLDQFLPTACLFPTVEDLFSGGGFSRFCQAATSDKSLQGKDAIQRYNGAGEAAITSAVDSYASLLGQLLCELTLSYMPSAGIYLAGSVARAIAGAAPGSCLETFTQPCKIKGDKTPDLFVIKDDFAALHGCAVFQP